MHPVESFAFSLGVGAGKSSSHVTALQHWQQRRGGSLSAIPSQGTCTLLMSECRSLLIAKNKMLNPSEKKKIEYRLTWYLKMFQRKDCKKFYLSSSALLNSSPFHKHQGGNFQNLKKPVPQTNHYFSSTSPQTAKCVAEAYFQYLFIKLSFWSKNSKYFRMAEMPWICWSKPEWMQGFLIYTGGSLYKFLLSLVVNRLCSGPHRGLCGWR